MKEPRRSERIRIRNVRFMDLLGKPNGKGLQVLQIAVVNKLHKLEKIVDAKNECRRQLSRAQDTLFKLYEEQYNTREQFFQFQTILNGYLIRHMRRDNRRNGLDITYERILRADSKAQRLNKMIMPIQTRVQDAIEIVEVIQRYHRSFTMQLHKSIHLVRMVKSVAELDRIRLPRLKWLKSIRVPDAAKLENEWDLTTLPLRMEFCITLLKRLIKVSRSD